MSGAPACRTLSQQLGVSGEVLQKVRDEWAKFEMGQ
jgi:hypothetical protein